MKATIVSGGKPPSKSMLLEEIKDSEIIIGADSGANALYNYGVTPHILLGDFDSIDENILSYYKASHCNINIYPPEKDYTDTELALIRAIELGAKEICFLGCTGSRIDHVLGNLGLLRRCLLMGIKAYIRDDNNYIFLVKEPCVFKGTIGQTISFQAYSEEVKALNIYDAKYDLRDYDLVLGDPITVSNEFIKEEIRIEFKKGILMVIYSQD